MRRLTVISLLVALTVCAGASASSSSTTTPTSVTTQLALAHIATAKYAADLARAKADGYQIITRMIPNMGYHFLNPKVKGFDIRKPPIPAKQPIEGARYGAFGAACHYIDGTLVFADSQNKCAPKSPETGAKFGFWHPPLVTMHVWLWYPNPSGLFSGTNPLVT